MVTKLTTVMELKGIIIAATNGDKFPLIAKLNPTILYRMDSPKLM